MRHLFHRFEVKNQHRYKMQPASIRDRVIAQLVDGIFLGATCTAIFYYFSDGEIHSIWVSPVFPQYLLEIAPGHLQTDTDFWWGGAYFSWKLLYNKTVHLNYPAPLLWAIYIFYYTIFISKTGQTPGKMMKKLVILDVAGKQVDFKKALLRWMGYFVSLIPFGAGIWWGFKDENHRTWHDYFANTIVYVFEEK